MNEAAQELNMGLRFTRSDGQLDKVAPVERQAFLQRHRKWHNDVRIDDMEIVGSNLRTQVEAVVFVAVVWHRADGQDTHTTVVAQTWKDDRGTWRLVNEIRQQGDTGLLGDDPAPPAAGEASPQPRREARDVQFRTTVIRPD